MNWFTTRNMIVATAAAFVYVAVIPDVPEHTASAATPHDPDVYDQQIAFDVGSPPDVDAPEGGGAVVVSAPSPPPVEPTPPPPTTEVERQPNPRTLAALRMCESTNRYNTNTGNGYYGAYQFDVPTWNGVAQRHLPHLVGVPPHWASSNDQDAMAWWLWQERGDRPWPVCGPRSWRA